MVVKERMHFQRKTCFSCGHIKQLSQFCDAKLALREERMMRVLMIRKTLWGKKMWHASSELWALSVANGGKLTCVELQEWQCRTRGARQKYVQFMAYVHGRNAVLGSYLADGYL